MDAGEALDTLDGGWGDDEYHVRGTDSGRDVLRSDIGGIDTVHAHNMSWILDWDFENLTFHDDFGSFFFGQGNQRDNIIDGGRAAGVEFFGRGGNDRLIAGVFGGSEMHGEDGNDTLLGAGQVDVLSGGAGNDVLDGNSSYDAADSLSGGAGADAFVLRGHGGLAAHVADFLPSVDKIRLDGADAGGFGFRNVGLSGNFSAGDARFWASASGTAHDADDRVIYNTGTGDLWYDEDGSGASAARHIAVLQGAPALTATDVEVINGELPGQSINGTAGNDSLSGTDANDTLNGLGGNDTLEGNGGADRLEGGAGNDSLYGGHNNVADRADVMIGGDGNDTLNGDASPFGNWDIYAETLDGGLGNDHFVVDNPNDVLIDAGGIDTIEAVNMDWMLADGFENLKLSNGENESQNVGIGNAANNRMEGGYIVRLEGRGGNDTLIGSTEEDILIGDEGDDVLDGLGHNDTLQGGAGNDRLSGADGNDILTGGDGNDWLDGGTEAPSLDNRDMLTGGAGADSFVFSDRPRQWTDDSITDFASGIDSLRFDAAAMAELGASGRFAAGDARFYAAASATSGHDADDRLIYNTSTRQLFFDADGSGSQAGSLVATLQVGAVLAATDIVIDNGTGGQNIVGTAGNDSVVGTGGNDTLDGLGGVDTLNGGGGDDLYIVTAGDVIVENAFGGLDRVESAVSWTLANNVEDLTLTGTAATTANGNNLANVLTGNNANNSSINGRAGNDTMFGMGGNDVFDMSTGGTSSYGNDVIDGGTGVDSVEFGGNARTAVNINLTAGTASGGGDGGAGSATLASIENALGGNFNDTITGSAGANYFRGGSGNDTLNGKAGNDRLQGDAGNDAFVFDAIGTANSDTVIGFASGADKVHLENSVMIALGAAGAFVAGDVRYWEAAGATSGHDANDRVVYNTTNGNLYYDADGSGAGAAQLIAQLQGAPAFTDTDVFVI